MNPTNFIGGKLKLKNQKTDRTITQVKKVITKDIPVNILKKESDLDLEKRSHFKSNIDKDISNEETVGHLNNDEEKYMKSLEEEIKQTKQNNEIDVYDKRTEAERLFEERKLKRLPEKIRKHLSSSYKQKCDNFNKTLTKLPEHYDIPKVGPG